MVPSVRLSTMHFKKDQRAEGAFAGLFDLEMCFMRGRVLYLLALSLFDSALWIPAVHMNIFSMWRKLAVAYAQFPSPPQTK